MQQEKQVSQDLLDGLELQVELETLEQQVMKSLKITTYLLSVKSCSEMFNTHLRKLKVYSLNTCFSF